MVLLLAGMHAGAQGIVFHEGNFASAVQKAKKENKFVFVDFYAVWCGPCKYMSASVFPNATIGEYFNANFVNVKIDAEKQEKELVSKSKIEAYPTLGFFNGDGQLVFSSKGALDANGLLDLGMKVREFENNRIAYEKDPKDINAMTAYTTVLMQSNPEKAKSIVRTYLAGLPMEDSKKPEIWPLIANFEQDPDSKYFAYTLQNFTYFLNNMPGYQEYFTNTAGILLDRAIQARDEKLVAEYKEITIHAIEQMNVPMPEGFNEEVDIYYYSQTGQSEKHLAALDSWIMNSVTDVEVISNNTLETMDRYGLKAKNYCLKWAEKALGFQKSFFTYITLAYVYKASAMKAEALRYAEEAKKLATPDDDMAFYEAFMQELNAMK